VRTNNSTKARLRWTFSYICCTFVHPDLDSAPLFIGIQERSISASRNWITCGYNGFQLTFSELCATFVFEVIIGFSYHGVCCSQSEFCSHSINYKTRTNPDLACITFPALANGDIFSRAYQRRRVFPRLPAAARFPALAKGYQHD